MKRAAWPKKKNAGSKLVTRVRSRRLRKKMQAQAVSRAAIVAIVAVAVARQRRVPAPPALAVIARELPAVRAAPCASVQMLRRVDQADRVRRAVLVDRVRVVSVAIVARPVRVVLALPAVVRADLAVVLLADRVRLPRSTQMT